MPLFPLRPQESAEREPQNWRSESSLGHPRPSKQEEIFPAAFPWGCGLRGRWAARSGGAQRGLVSMHWRPGGASAHREGRGCWAWPGPRGRGGRAGRRVSGVLVLVTPSCLGDRQQRAVGASRWRGGRRGVFAQLGAPAKGGGGGRGGSWSRARGWQDWGEGAGKGEVYLRGCLCAAIYDRQESNSMNHRELPER